MPDNNSDNCITPRATIVNSIDSVSAWLTFSSSYFLPSVVFYLLLSLVIVLVVRNCIPVENRLPLQTDVWIDQFGWMCLVNFVVLVFASYGPIENNAGITWHYPPLLIIGILCSAICWSCKFHRNVSSVWLYLGFFQLGLLLSYG